MEKQTKTKSFFYIIAPSQPPFSSIVCGLLTYTLSIVLSAGFLCAGGGVEFASDQVSPKKEIPMELKPKSSAAGCGLKGLVAVEEMLMWCRS